MNYVFITAAAILVCSLGGAAIGFLFKNISAAVEDAVTGAAAGIMLCAAILCLVVPSLELSAGAFTSAAGIACGAAFISALNRFGSKICGKIGMKGSNEDNLRALAFVLAIAVHHFPEGIAAGVSFGTGDLSDAVSVAGGIAIQNIPEGMIIIPPLLKSGLCRKKAAVIAAASAFAEVLGLAMGSYLISLSQSILPFALAFASGTMLYVIVDDMVPQTHRRKSAALATYALITGFCLMLFLTAI